jgi:hypothetical protein
MAACSPEPHAWVHRDERDALPVRYRKKINVSTTNTGIRITPEYIM